MAKRKQQSQSDSEDEGSDVSLIDVDFEFFDPNPSVDYLALKRLLGQLFQADSELFHLHELTDLILSQPLVGTSVKTDGKESDPYAFLTVLNLHVHKDHPSIRAFVAYVLLKSASNIPLLASLQTLLGPDGLKSENHVGFIFSERLVNMPVQVVPPMYRMLADEIKLAMDENQPYKFSHFIYLTRTYKLTEEEAASLNSKPRVSKRSKNGLDVATPPGDAQSIYSFHPEDEYIQKVAQYTADYALNSAQPREKDSFGLDIGGRIMLVPAARFQEFINQISEAYAVPQ